MDEGKKINFKGYRNQYDCPKRVKILIFLT